ncbi:MAG TPA: PQQ-dependent sugar dehydrogenase [Solirubrobacteraceae bacterium]|nr:PQQ-dependent sugar dehydrogenase [Solirubrobacteraceae bacterium]
MTNRRGATPLLIVASIALLPCATAVASPVGLLDTKLPVPTSDPLSSPTAITPILDSGRALVLEKGGAVRVLQADGTMLATDALTLDVCTDSEQGLLGAAVDPGFAVNGFVYLYYSRDAGNCASSTGRFNRVSRFTMTGDTINPASEVVLLDNMNIPAGNHNGGDLHIGNDGDLYVSVGDGGTNPRGSGPSAAQDLSLLNGKILRITTSGGVPADNPFVGTPNATSCATLGIGAPTSAKCAEIYDYGLRNPYRFAFDPNTSATRFFINDVGQDTWEEVDEGGSGLDYGWDSREGFCDEGSSTVCPPTPAGFTDPLTAYNHSTGCTFITAGAFIPNGIWATTYDGGYLFADGGCGKIFLRRSDGSVDYASPFAQTSGVISDMAFITQEGQTALYYVTNEAGELHKITLPAPVLTLTPPTPGTASTVATRTQAPVAPPTSCRIVDVRELLASTARVRIAASHCKPHEIVVAMRDGRAVRRHHEFVRAGATARPKRSPGPRRVWTLRVESVVQKPGRTYSAGTAETVWVGWEATPRGIAGKPGGRYV